MKLPSGCHLVKLNILKSLLDRIDSHQGLDASKRGSVDSWSDVDVDENLNGSNERDASDSTSIDNDLVMDLLPDSTRFTTTNTLEQLNEIGIDLDSLDADDDDDGFELATNSSDQFAQIVVYVQKNSRLRLVLMSHLPRETEIANSKTDVYQFDNFIRIVGFFSCPFLL